MEPADHHRVNKTDQPLTGPAAVALQN